MRTPMTIMIIPAITAFFPKQIDVASDGFGSSWFTITRMPVMMSSGVAPKTNNAGFMPPANPDRVLNT